MDFLKVGDGGLNGGAVGSDTMSGGCNSVLWTGDGDKM